MNEERILAVEERIRMTEEAIGLFENWRVQSLLSRQETEAILHQVMAAGPGDIDQEDLVRLARTVASDGSIFALYLADNSTRQ